jgi:hypothetical protein
MIEQTQPLRNGDLLPKHPSTTTAREVVQYLKVWDANDNHQLSSGQLRGTEVSMLMGGSQMALGHLYLFTIRDNRIYHTRQSVVIDVETDDAPVEV